jgi:integrase/recombinase XerD
MKDLKDRMMEDMKLRSLAAGTQKGYLDAITALAEHYHRRPDQLSQEQIRDYLLYLIETRKFAKSTFKIHLSALKFLYRRTLGRPWPVLELPRIKTEKKLPVVLSREEVWSLLDRVRRPQARMSLILMYTCGLRVSEALHLRIQDIDSQRMVVWVRNGKGDKDRSVPLPQQTLTQLRAYWAEYRPAT